MDKSPSIQSKSKKEYLILLKWCKFCISVPNFTQNRIGFLVSFGASGLKVLSLLIIKNANKERVIQKLQDGSG